MEGDFSLEVQPPNSNLPLGADGLPLSAVGPRAPYQFVKAYFPEAEQIIRIASAYFTLSGYKLGRKHVAEAVQFRILVGKEDGRNVRLAVLDETWDDLQRCDTDLWQTVDELVRKLKSGQLKIVDARATIAAIWWSHIWSRLTQNIVVQTVMRHSFRTGNCERQKFGIRWNQRR